MKSKKLLKYLLIVAGILIVFSIIGKKAGWFGKAILTKVSTDIVQKRTIVEQINSNGKIQPEMEIKISSEVSGEVVVLNVKEGQQVKKGDLLVKINPEIYLAGIDRMAASLNTTKANLANSKARLLQAEAQFKAAELSFNRNKQLWKDKAISDAEYENALSNYEIAKADVEAAKQSVNSSKFSVMSSEASLRESNENLSKTAIYAPMSGTISRLNVEVGERVLGTIQMAGTELMRIANLDKMEVQVDVNENDIVRVKLRDTAIIEVDAYLGEKFKGVVTEIANSASVSGTGTDEVTNFKVKIGILKSSYEFLIPKDNPNYYPFRPGLSATADIQTKTKYNVLTVPIQAITTRTDTIGIVKTEKKEFGPPDEGLKLETENKIEAKNTEPLEVVFVYKNGKSILKKVTTGIQDDHYIEIVKGLSDTSEVITSPYSVISKRLKNGMAVEKVEKDQLFMVKK